MTFLTCGLLPKSITKGHFPKFQLRLWIKILLKKFIGRKNACRKSLSSFEKRVGGYFPYDPRKAFARKFLIVRLKSIFSNGQFLQVLAENIFVFGKITDVSLLGMRWDFLPPKIVIDNFRKPWDLSRNDNLSQEFVDERLFSRKSSKVSYGKLFEIFITSSSEGSLWQCNEFSLVLRRI